MPPGPPPLPTETKKLRGTHRPHRDGPVDHAFDQLPTNGIKRPAELSGDAAEIWDKLVPPMVKLKVIRDVDLPVAAGMCRWYALWRELDQRLQTEEVCCDPKDIDEERHAALVQRRADGAWKNFTAAAARLGFTPADRARIRAGKDAGGSGDPKSPLEFFGIPQRN
ncbi:MAG: P27 family phage terminase small subunit [Planctomycetota bacterium]